MSCSRLMMEKILSGIKSISPAFLTRYIPCAPSTSPPGLSQRSSQSPRPKLQVLTASSTEIKRPVDSLSSKTSGPSPPPDSTLVKWLEQQFQTRKASARLSSTSLSIPTAPFVEVHKDTQNDLPFFRYRDYPNPPKVVYTSCQEEANTYLSQLEGPALGLDLEWMTFSLDRSISLIQFCDENLVVLFQLGKNCVLPEEAIKLINNPEIYKLGVNIKGDLNRLIENFSHDNDFKPASFLELSRLARMVEPEWRGKGRRLISLADQCQHFLRKTLNKDESIRQGDWDSELKEEATDYAANDVYSSLKIYDELIFMSELKKITIDYPYLCVDLDPPPKSKRYSTPTEEELEARYNAPPIKYRIAGREFQHRACHPKLLPSEIRAFDAFLKGVGVKDYAEEFGIQIITVQTYISKAVKRFGMRGLTEEEQTRFMAEAHRRPPSIPVRVPASVEE